jgi:hypothetical protein
VLGRGLGAESGGVGFDCRISDGQGAGNVACGVVTIGLVEHAFIVTGQVPSGLDVDAAGCGLTALAVVAELDFARRHWFPNTPRTYKSLALWRRRWGGPTHRDAASSGYPRIANCEPSAFWLLALGEPNAGFLPERLPKFRFSLQVRAQPLRTLGTAYAYAHRLALRWNAVRWLLNYRLRFACFATATGTDGRWNLGRYQLNYREGIS